MASASLSDTLADLRAIEQMAADKESADRARRARTYLQQLATRADGLLAIVERDSVESFGGWMDWLAQGGIDGEAGAALRLRLILGQDLPEELERLRSMISDPVSE